MELEKLLFLKTSHLMQDILDSFELVQQFLIVRQAIDSGKWIEFCGDQVQHLGVCGCEARRIGYEPIQRETESFPVNLICSFNS